MDNLVRAKVIIELLDDTKYPILSSLTPMEISKLDSVDMSSINELSNIQVNAIVNDFIKHIETKQEDVQDKASDQPDQEAVSDQSEESTDTSEDAQSSESAVDSTNEQNLDTDTSNQSNIESDDAQKSISQSENGLDTITDIGDKIHAQPSQVIACIITKLDDQKKDQALASLTDEKRQEVLSIDVDTIPMSDQVINLIIKELELA